MIKISIIDFIKIYFSLLLKFEPKGLLTLVKLPSLTSIGGRSAPFFDATENLGKLFQNIIKLN